MSVSSEVARIAGAKALLVGKMTAAGYDVSENDQIQDLVAVLDLGGGATDPGVYPGGSVVNEMDRISAAKTVLVSKMLAAGYDVSGDMLLGELVELLNLIGGTVVGTCWDWSSDSTALKRLTTANDPNGYVNTNITREPVAAVGTGNGSSPFDYLYPWSGMYECNHDGATVTYRKGETGFSRTANDTVIWIPEYYVKVINDVPNMKTYYYIADHDVSGFTKMEGSGKFVGRYKTGARYGSLVTRSGLSPNINISRPSFRTQSRQKGGKWRMNDYATWCAYSYLYLIEYADWNSQATIGMGYTINNSSPTNTGGTDIMTYHTGSAGTKTTGKYSVQYRGIEDPFGNVGEWVDGINFFDRKAYICSDPSKYADDTTTGYTDTGITVCENGFIKSVTPCASVGWAYFFPTANGGSSKTYVPDTVRSNTGWRGLYVSGDYADSIPGEGFWYFFLYYVSGTANNVGSRLLVDP